MLQKLWKMSNITIILRKNKKEKNNIKNHNQRNNIKLIMICDNLDLKKVINM